MDNNVVSEAVSTGTATGRDRSRRLRLGAFTLSVLAALVLSIVMMGNELVLAFTGWFEDMGIHQVHDLTLFALLWLAYVVPMALLLYRPTGRVNTAIAPLVFLVPIAVFAYLASSPILMLPVVFGVLGLVVLVLHPAGRDLLRFDRTEHVNRYLAGLLVVAAVPLLVYAGDQVVRQLTASDDHALFVHFAAMAVSSVYVVLMGAMAAVRQRDWRFAAWSAGAVAVVVGAASVAFGTESSVGPLWGALAIAWGIAFIAGTEYVRREQASLDATPEAGVGVKSA